METLACLLDIGPERTLLRRHLSEEFANLLDSSVCHRKQRFTTKDSAVAAPALNPSAKLKVGWLVLLLTYLIRRMSMAIGVLEGRGVSGKIVPGPHAVDMEDDLLES